MENKSEVAKLLEEIRRSYESAKLGMHGTAITAPHEFITKRMEHIQEVHVVLQGVVGSETAMKLITETLENI